MCDFGDEFILCSCGPVGLGAKAHGLKNSFEDKPGVITWELRRKISCRLQLLFGETRVAAGPHEILSGNVTTQFILQKINEGNCFDFDYTPWENDEPRFHLRLPKYRMTILKYCKREWIRGSRATFEGWNQETIGTGAVDTTGNRKFFSQKVLNEIKERSNP